MKKLLMLVLVLGIVSIAGAEIMSPMEIKDLGAGEYGIDLTSGMSAATDVSGGYWVLIGVDATSGALASAKPVILDLSGIGGDAGDTGLFAAGSGVYGEFTASSTSTTWTAASGVYADSFTAQTGVDTLYLYTLDDYAEGSTLVDTFVIPEPATMLILGLGGLLLRRKK